MSDYGGGPDMGGGELGSGYSGDDGRQGHTRRGTSNGPKGSVVIDVVSHGACDLKAEFIRAASALKLVPIDKYRPNLSAQDKVEKKLLDKDAWNPPDDERVMPGGHYPNATGWTRLWRQFWQIGRRECSWRIWEPLEPFYGYRTYLEISCITWYFAETADFQTHLVIDVKYLPAWVPTLQRWMYDGPQFDLHLKAAEDVAERLRHFIANHPAMPISQAIRQSMKARSLPKESPAPTDPANPGHQCPQNPAGTAPVATSSAPPAAPAAPTSNPVAQPAGKPAGKGSGADLSNLFDGLPLPARPPASSPPADADGDTTAGEAGADEGPQAAKKTDTTSGDSGV